MSNDRIVLQLTIVVNGEGQAVIKLDPCTGGSGTVVTTGPCAGTPAVPAGAGSAPPGTGSAPVGSGTAPVGTGSIPVATGGAPVGTGCVPAATGATVSSGTSGAVPSAPTAKCVAQRTVHIVAGNGGLAWFTLIWPLPEVIAYPNAMYSYDSDRTTAGLVPATPADHPLYARKIGARVVWEGIGAHGQPSVFVAGMNQTHTGTPDTTMLVGGPEVIAAGAALQSALAGPRPVLAFKEDLKFGPAPGAPAVAYVANVPNADAAVADLRAVAGLSAAVVQDLRPSPATLASWGIDGSTPQSVVTLATNLLFTANAFRLGLVSTVLLPAFNDDPHGAFAGGDAVSTTRANALARVLDGFYAELAAHVEPKCEPVGTPLALADNVVLVVSGDTFKDPFNRNGWGDGTPGQANLLYVRSNGYLKPGWFGNLGTNRRTNFDPTTGAPSTTTFAAASTTAAQLGILFAIARGDAAAVARASTAPYAGVIATTLP